MVCQKDTEVLMKTNLNTIFFLCSDHHREPATLSGSLPVYKTGYNRKMTMFSRQLIYESTADDVFWVFQMNSVPPRCGEFLGF
jgi:hypothetical protein